MLYTIYYINYEKVKNLCNASFFSKLDSNAASSPPALESATSSGDPPPNSSKNSCTSEVELSESLKNEITLNYLKTEKKTLKCTQIHKMKKRIFNGRKR